MFVLCKLSNPTKLFHLCGRVVRLAFSSIDNFWKGELCICTHEEYGRTVTWETTHAAKPLLSHTEGSQDSLGTFLESVFDLPGDFPLRLNFPHLTSVYSY
jgi:hypothetical protein